MSKLFKPKIKKYGRKITIESDLSNLWDRYWTLVNEVQALYEYLEIARITYPEKTVTEKIKKVHKS